MNALRIEPARWGALRQVGLAGLLLWGCGCAHMPFRREQSAANIAAPGQGTLTISELQSEVMRYADGYVTSVAQAVDESAAGKVGTQKAAALRWKIDQATAVYTDATGANPVWNALDVVVFATVSRMVVEDEKTREEFGDAVLPLIATHRRLEQDAWTLVGGFLTPEQIQELQGLIAEWRKQNPGQRGAAGVHFREFVQSFGKVPGATQVKQTSIFSMLYINPLAGLDPTTVAIEQSRELAERVVAYAERAPTLMRWQAELLTLQVAEQPAWQQVLSDLGRTSGSMDSISKTAEGLPELVDAQRKAAIDQLFQGVAAERSAILAELNSKEATIQTLLGQLRETMNAGGEMGKSLTATIQSLDSFVHYVSPPQSVTAPPPAEAGKPFNVLDYGKTATDVGGMARDLSALLGSVDKSVPAIARASQEAGENLKGVVDHAFWRGLVLILTLLVGSVPAALTYKALARKLARGESSPQASCT
jgi:hypothetical protein